MGCSWQSPNNEHAAAAAVPEAIDLATALREGKDCRRGAGSADAAAGHNVSAASRLEVNPAVQLFSSGVPFLLNSLCSAGEHLDR
jgi:hypothetical protein